MQFLVICPLPVQFLGNCIQVEWLLIPHALPEFYVCMCDCICDCVLSLCLCMCVLMCLCLPLRVSVLDCVYLCV